MKVKFVNGKWIELPKNSKEGFYLDSHLKRRLDNVRKIQDKDWSATLLLDGDTRTGKSTLAMTMAWYLSDETLTMENFAQGLSDCAEKIKTLPDKSILIVDEGSLTFSSKDAMKKEQKTLMKILDVVAQKNLIIIVCLPSFFELNRPIATYHSLFLLHVYSDSSWNRGRFAYFSRKKKKVLYVNGKKNFGSYKVPPANFCGRFTKFELPFHKEYLKLKRRSLMEALDSSKPKLNKTSLARYRLEIMLKFIETCPHITTKDICKGFGISTTEFYRQRVNYLKAKKEVSPTILSKPYREGGQSEQ